MRALLCPLCSLWLAGVLIAAAGCDNTVAPVADDPEAFYALYGYLDTASDTHFVRVAPIRTTLEPPATPHIDAVVRLQRFDAPAPTSVWQDSTVLLDDGRRAALFFSTQPVLAGAAYTLTVTRSDGAQTSAVTWVPEAPRPSVSPPHTIGIFSQVVSWSGMRRTPDQAIVTYSIKPSVGVPEVEVSYRYASLGSLSGSNWHATVRLAGDLSDARTRLGINQNDRTAILTGVRMEIELQSDEWRQPVDAALNIKNGRGFFGSIGRFTASWVLDTQVVLALGFLDGQSR